MEREKIQKLDFSVLLPAIFSISDGVFFKTNTGVHKMLVKGNTYYLVKGKPFHFSGNHRGASVPDTIYQSLFYLL